MPASRTRSHILTNADVAELLAEEAESAKMPLQKALRRASRRAFLWPEEVSQMVQQETPLTDLPGIGPHLNRLILRWLDDPPVIPQRPILRRDFFTLTQVRATLQKQPEWLQKIKGDLQMHSQWSDGSGSIEEMAIAGEERKYDYIAITDHSKGLKIAGGIDEEQLRQQEEEIAELNQTNRRNGKQIRVLRSIELNLDPRGKGDMDSKSLLSLDLVLGCFHSSLRRKEDQTERYLAALKNPDIQILGHPRGRIYNFRAGLTADWPRVFDLAAELDKAVEIDSYPDRQDLSLDLIKLARKAGCRISIGTDAHDPEQLRFIEFGLAAALSAKVNPDRILNFITRDQLLGWAAQVRN